ncbi:hypothetical protein SUGI_0666250 [Cryptomeria japonica]|uniref:uncharacterized protein LOC131857146 n=1 Tax=Cryptomeria japonica TaxID=3369 RepID=UPI0024148C87|nr:uncharacterized protein LOC131857146 [Cryptomeria japonica]GLJ33104.1 hypothetical protein SUGI_0666250 [Cryptomeria japonica]
MQVVPNMLYLCRLDANAGLLSNFEVMDLLRSRGATQDPLGSFGSATRSECQVFDYLVQSPAGTLTREIVREFLLKAEKFSLTKAERVQVLNLRPSTAVEVHMIIEDCEERMSSSTVDEFLEMVKSSLPPPPMKPQVEDEEENDEADEENDEADEGNDVEMDAEEEVE